MKKFCPKRITSGFTLVEILVTISISVFLFALGLARYNEFNRRQILNLTTQEVKNNLRLAQGKALAGEKPTGCETLNGYQVNFFDANPDYYTIGPVCSSPYPSPNIYLLPRGVSFSSLPSPNPIIFKVIGQGTNIPNSTTIVLSGFNQTQTITVNAMGEIR